MNNLKAKFKHIYILGRYPETDWRRLFVFFIFIALLIAAWSTYSFISIKNETLTSQSGNISGRILAESKEKELRSVLEKYQNKEKKYLELQSASYFRTPIATTTEDEMATSTI